MHPLNYLAGAAASVLALFGAHYAPLSSTTASSTVHTTPTHTAHTTHAHGQVNLTCVGAAVATREATIDSDVSTYTAAVNTAYTTRASALAAAYSETSTTTVRTDVKAAWSSFDASRKSAASTAHTADMAAWTQFSTSVKECGVTGEEESDAANAASDSISGS